MNEEKVNKIAEVVKDTQNGNTITDLVFNPTTGEFEEAPWGITNGAGEVVTDMTKDGFA
ncbi:MAG: hypothetical protein IJP44_12135 [Bacteroidales bacterium]|nr:hypothetical protein [Bacteroidales bacterium]